MMILVDVALNAKQGSIEQHQGNYSLIILYLMIIVIYLASISSVTTRSKCCTSPLKNIFLVHPPYFLSRRIIGRQLIKNSCHNLVVEQWDEGEMDKFTRCKSFSFQSVKHNILFF